MIKSYIPKTKAEVYASHLNPAHAVPGGPTITVAQETRGYARTVLKLSGTRITLADNPGVIAYGGVKIFTAPEGLVLVGAAVADLVITKSSAGVNATFRATFGIGSTTADNTATLTTTEQNVIPSTAAAQAIAGSAVAKAISASGAAVQLDGTATAVALYLNAVINDADHDVTTTACDLIFNGTISLLWALGGDK